MLVGMPQETISDEIALCMEMEVTSKTGQTANFQDNFHRYASNRTDYTCQRKDNSIVIRIVSFLASYQSSVISHFLVTEPSASALTSAPLPAMRTGFLCNVYFKLSR